ncbi:hypothetical protein GCM10011506_25170 [Marivirga lumbricoides]|uniref:Dihydrolipoamide acetyltransferase component of pyruvate dehydrogenase complex n=1 Tax=Marivirga lumbricoides TaxID=1046115 RepID=A0ABQ1MGP3_9BACT|nr:hypothetical protein GCM10011506_25170 [Marivirga lumbricoides]
MAKEVKIPQISEGVESATVAEIMVAEGDTIEKEQSIIALETDKASVEVPSSDAGKVKEIKLKEGDEVKVGDVVLILEEDGEEGEDSGEEASDDGKENDTKQKKQKKDDSDDEEEDEDDEVEEEKAGKKADKKEKKSSEEKEESDSEADEEDDDKEDEEDDSDEEEKDPDEKEKADKKEQPKKQKSDSSKSDTAQDNSEVAASPATRRLAREMGVSISQVKGSGPGGRISEEDVKSHAKKKEGSALSLPDFSQWGKVEREPLSGIRKATAKNVTASWQNIPHVFQFDEADISGIEEYMEKNKEQVEKAGGKLTITAVLLKIAASALQQFPKFNASIDEENDEMILKKYVNIGIAVATDKGLLVPVVRDVNRKSIIELSIEINELAKKARDQKLTAEDMQGGNFTISNLGGIGGTNFTPIIYHPQVAILGISQTSIKPVYVEGSFEPKPILPLSLSYDHRLIDGAEGAEFIKWISQALEDPYKALLGA